jgi:hypothetical protein
MSRSRAALARRAKKSQRPGQRQVQQPVAPAVATPLFPPISRRTVAVFVAALVILLVPWPGYGRVFRGFFSGFGNAVLAVTGAGVTADPTFSANPPSGATADAGLENVAWSVWLHAGEGPAAVAPPMPLDTRILGYTPLALLVALVAASAVPWRRRVAVLAVGGSLLLLRLAVAIAMAVGRAYGQSAERPRRARRDRLVRPGRCAGCHIRRAAGQLGDRAGGDRAIRVKAEAGLLDSNMNFRLSKSRPRKPQEFAGYSPGTFRVRGLPTPGAPDDQAQPEFPDCAFATRRARAGGGLQRGAYRPRRSRAASLTRRDSLERQL